MGQEPDDIREDIEATRGRMTETVEALGYKTDVKSRAKERVQSASDKIAKAADSALGRVQGGAREMASETGSMTSQAGEAVKDSVSRMGEHARKGVGLAEENPLGLAIGAAAVGFVVGTLVPSSRVEDEKLGPTADRVRMEARDLGHEVAQRGKTVASETATTAAEAAKDTFVEQGQKQAKAVAASAQEKMDDINP